MGSDYRSIDGLSREDLIGLVAIMMTGGTDSEEGDSELMRRIARNVPSPHVSDLIFHSFPSLTAVEVVDQALGYKPIEP